MALSINTNASSSIAQRALSHTSTEAGTTFQRLSTGLRINGGADDPAGIAISEQLRAQIRSFDQASRNANDGISLAQTAEGALSSVSDNLSRMRELAVQSANGTNSDSDRQAMQNEFDQLSQEIGRTIDATQFNGKQLLDGSGGSVSLQVGTEPQQQVNIDLASAHDATASVSGASISSAQGAADAVEQVDEAIRNVGSMRGSFAATQNRLESVMTAVNNSSDSLTASRARITDTDFAAETAQLARKQIMQQASVSMLAQANQRAPAVLSLLG